MTKNEIIAHINAVIAAAEYCKNAYFWSPAGNANGRRSNERNRKIPVKDFTIDGVEWSLGYDYTESCAHVYASGAYYRDGSRVTLAAVKKLLKHLILNTDKNI